MYLTSQRSVLDRPVSKAKLTMGKRQREAFRSNVSAGVEEASAWEWGSILVVLSTGSFTHSVKKEFPSFDLST